MIIRTSSRRAVEDLVSMPLMPTDAGAGQTGDQEVRHGGEVGDMRFAVNRLAGRSPASTSTGDSCPTRAVRAAPSTHDCGSGSDPDSRLARDAIDQHRLGLHRETEIVGRPVTLELTPASGLNSKVVTTGPDESDDGTFHGEFAALILQEACAVHQFALVDLAFGLGRIEGRRRRHSRPCGVRPALETGSGSGSGS
jgi:hypothetical protein